MRSEVKRKMNDEAGADRDYGTAYNMEQNREKQTASANTTVSNAASNNPSAVNDENTREQSDKNINKFNRLVVYDKEEERKNKYNSDIRGRVQDKNVQVNLEPMFVLTYYEKADPVKKIVYYDKSLEEYNRQMLLSRKLLLTNEEAPLNEYQVDAHFNSINQYSARIEKNPADVTAFFARGIDLMLVQDFSEAIKDYTTVISLQPEFAMAYFNRAVLRYKQLDYDLSQMNSTANDNLSTMSMNFNIGNKQVAAPAAGSSQSLASIKEDKRAYEHELISRDYDMAIKLNPEFVYAYFNRGNLRCAQRDFRAAILDYNEAIRHDPDFAEAYFNRGLARLSQGDAQRGIADLRKAGELGIIHAYNIIKRMTSNSSLSLRSFTDKFSCKPV